MNRIPDIPWMKHVKAIEKHLGKNEKYFQYREKNMQSFIKEMDTWNKDFLEKITFFEDMMREFEKKME